MEVGDCCPWEDQQSALSITTDQRIRLGPKDHRSTKRATSDVVASGQLRVLVFVRHFVFDQPSLPAA